MRVQIPAYTDHWMKGDRFGEVVRTGVRKVKDREISIAHVKLDISGKVAIVPLDDCKIV